MRLGRGRRFLPQNQSAARRSSHASLASRRHRPCVRRPRPRRPRRGRAQGRQRPLPAHGLSRGQRAAGHDLEHQLAPAELWRGAGAPRAVGCRRAVGLDRDAARRRAAGRRGDAGDQQQRIAAASARRPGERGDGHADADRERGGAGYEGQPADRGDARERPSGQAVTRSEAAGVARQREVELRVSNRGEERQRQEPAGEPRRAGSAEFRHLVHRGLRARRLRCRW